MMSAQPGNAPVPPYAPAPGVPAEFLTQLRADTWASAFECEGAAALEESRRTFSPGGLYEVYRSGRAASPPRRPSTRLSPPATTTATSSARPYSGAAPVTEQPYAVRFSAPPAKVLDTLG